MRQFTLYRMFDFIGDLVYVGKSTNAFKRLDDHRLGKPWADEIVDISYQRFPDHAVLLRAETLEIPTEHPMPPSGGFSFGVRHGWQTMSHVGRFCSLIPGLGVKLSNDHPCRAHCSLRGRGGPSA
jgi:hypothetical protein